MTARPPHLALVAANGTAAPARIGCRHLGVWRRGAVERVLPAGDNLVCLYAAGGDVLWLETALVRQLHEQLERPELPWGAAQRAAEQALAAVMAAQPEAIKVKPRRFPQLGRFDFLRLGLVCVAIAVGSAAIGWFLL